MLKKVKDYPNGSDVKEEREFVEKIFKSQTGPVHNYIKSPWTNNVRFEPVFSSDEPHASFGSVLRFNWKVFYRFKLSCSTQYVF